MDLITFSMAISLLVSAPGTCAALEIQEPAEASVNNSRRTTTTATTISDGTAKDVHKISKESGNFFTFYNLDNDDHFGCSVAAMGDIDGNGVAAW